MDKITDINEGVPGGWRYHQKETNHWMGGITFGSLLGKIATHRQNNNIPIGDNLQAEVEDWICQNMEPVDRKQRCLNGPKYPKTIGWQHIESFLTTAVATAVGGKLVSQEEAERRAAICAACPLQAGLHGCSLCRTTLDALRKKLLQRSTSQDEKLEACGVCKCDNRAQVHVPIEALRAGSDKDYSDNPACWKLRAGVNESTE